MQLTLDAQPEKTIGLWYLNSTFMFLTTTFTKMSSTFACQVGSAKQEIINYCKTLCAFTWCHFSERSQAKDRIQSPQAVFWSSLFLQPHAPWTTNIQRREREKQKSPLENYPFQIINCSSSFFMRKEPHERKRPLLSTSYHRGRSDCWAAEEALAVSFSDCWMLAPASLQPLHILCSYNFTEKGQKTRTHSCKEQLQDLQLGPDTWLTLWLQ